MRHLRYATCLKQTRLRTSLKSWKIVSLVWQSVEAREFKRKRAGKSHLPAPYTNRQFSDRYACARSLVLIEVIVCGLSMKALHASPVVSTMAVSSLKMRFDRSFDRRDCQTFSTGFNSGDFDGSRMMVRFLATIRLPVLCHPARSMSPTACALRAPYLLIPSRCNCMASVLA